jgi:DnaJ-domain-containing protein 1
MPDVSATDRTAGEVDWPHWAERTPASERSSTHKFSVTMHQAIEDVETELVDRVGVDAWRLSTAAPHRKKDGLPYANASPDDPAVVIRWTMDGEQYCVAADEYTTVRDNVRAIGLYIEEKRKMSNRPVHTGQDEFATARLPSGNGDEEAIVATEPPHETLGVAPDAPEAVVKGAYRELLKERHPDHGGREAEFKRLQEAKEAMLEA